MNQCCTSRRIAQGSDGIGESRRAWEPRRVIHSRRGTEETARREWAAGRPPARGTEKGMEPVDLLCSRNARALPQKKVMVKTPLNIDLSLGLPNHMAMMDEIESPVEVHLKKI